MTIYKDKILLIPQGIRDGNCRIGDVLSGIIAGLLAQDYTYHCCISRRLPTRNGGDIASEKSEHMLMASDLIDNLGVAFKIKTTSFENNVV